MATGGEGRAMSVKDLWRDLLEQGYDVGSYETFLRWVRKVESKAVEKGYLAVRKGGKKRYLVKDPKGLLEVMCEDGYAY